MDTDNGPDTERPSSRDDYERAACVLTARDTTPPEADEGDDTCAE